MSKNFNSVARLQTVGGYDALGRERKTHCKHGHKFPDDARWAIDFGCSASERTQTSKRTKLRSRRAGELKSQRATVKPRSEHMKNGTSGFRALRSSVSSVLSHVFHAWISII